MPAYVLWNNKGGVGKSTLTFQLASAFARANPAVNTYVIDLSPQCDVSRMLLGGGHHGGENAILGIMQQTPRKTIQGYLSACYNDVANGIGWPDPRTYIISPNAIRSQSGVIPANLSLVCGDFDLERTIQVLALLPQPPPRGGRAPTGPHFSAYLLVRSFVRKLVEVLEEADPHARIFIDTDPYYNIITTHMGLLAAERWITAYTPSSQASQYAVYRSLEFLYDPASGLGADVARQNAMYPGPWYDNRGNPLQVPTLTVPPLDILLANMTTPYSSKNTPSYSNPQRLHQQTIGQVQSAVVQDHHVQPRIQTYVWDLQRLGLICDYNGIDLLSLHLGSSYPQPSSQQRYTLNRTGGTPIQLNAYQTNIRTLVGGL